MKFLALFLSFFILTLSAVPCCAFESGLKNTQELSALKEVKRQKTGATEKHSDKQQQENDCCSSCPPFYTCGSCTGFTLTAAYQLTFAMEQKVIQHHTAYLSAELSLIPIHIWQPPKL